MKKFKVEYIKNGQKKSIQVAAKTRSQAIDSVRSRKVGRIIKTSEVTTAPVLNGFATRIKAKGYFKAKLKLPDLIASLSQLSVMASAGISIHDSVREVAESSSNERLKEIFTRCYEDLNAGKSISASLENYSHELGDIVLAMIKLGENTGKLGESLKKLSEILQELYENQQKFKKAMRYPITVVIAIAIAFTILMLYVVPKFKEIFASFKAELPLPTVMMLSIEHALRHYGIFMLAGIIGAIFLHKYMYVRSRIWMQRSDSAALRIYLIGKVIRYASLSRFNLIFTELVRAGIPISEALDTSVRTVSNYTIKTRLMATRIGISRGLSLTESLQETELYESMLIQMVKAGENSGQLDAMLEKVTDYYKDNFNNIVDNLSSYIEPILMAFIAVMVLFLALGIFLPMWDLGNAIR